VIFFSPLCFGQGPLYPHRPQFYRYDPTGEVDFHAGIHSGSWTLRRQQILEEESKCPHRSCSDPYCQRCSKHLADYGHEYQYIHGPSQAKFWYRNTWKDIAPAVKRGYDEHGYLNIKRGFPAAVMSWEYQQVLNHAIWEQLQARNAAEIATAAKKRVDELQKLHDDSVRRLAESKALWDYQVENGVCVSTLRDSINVNEIPPCTKDMKIVNSSNNYLIKPCESEIKLSCEYCIAHAKYMKDNAYLGEVCRELELAKIEEDRVSIFAAKWAKIAKLSKADADIATRFKRIYHKPPRYQEVFAAENKTVEDFYKEEKQNEESKNKTNSIPEIDTKQN
jgi:hypothetical protein